MRSSLWALLIVVVVVQEEVAGRDVCRACQLHSSSAARLYIIERKDGPGSTLHNLIYALGAAARNGMNFGGVLSRGVHLNKGVNVTSMIVRALSISDPETVFGAKKNFERNFGSLAKLERHVGTFQDHERILLSAHSMVKDQGLEGIRKVRPNVTLDEYLSPTLLSFLRGRCLPWIDHCHQPKHDRLKVVMHARRGDHAGAADREFFRVAKIIRSISPDADMHVYSLVEGFNATAFRARGFTVHADDIRKVEADLLFSVWTEFATADVMVVDTSSFSWAPAFFNPNCVIFHPYSLHYSSDRLVLQSWVPSTDEPDVRACVKRQLLSLLGPPPRTPGGASPSPRRLLR